MALEKAYLVDTAFLSSLRKQLTLFFACGFELEPSIPLHCLV